MWRWVTAIVLVSAGVAAFVLWPRDIVASPELAAQLEANAIEFDGTTFAIADGDAWRKDDDDWVWHGHLFDPAWHEKNYRERDGQVFRVADDGEEYAVRYDFTSGFEDAATLPELVGIETGWTSFTLQSPEAKDVSDYVKLRQAILKGDGDFLDNRVEPTDERAHSGKQSLRCTAVAPSFGMVTSKASLDMELLHFKRGDRVHYSAWYWLDGELDWATLMDLETVWIEQHPGPRIVVSNGALEIELKWAAKPRWKQLEPVKLPLRRWVHVEVEYLLDEHDGRVKVWQDGDLLIDGAGQTLPLADTILNSMEVGLSATQTDAVIYVDDVEIRRVP